MSSAEWYKILLKKFVTEEVNEEGVRVPKETRIQRIVPEMDPGRTGSLMRVKGLSGDQMSFLMKMVFDILPTRLRLFRLHLADSPICDLCDSGTTANLSHSLTQCQFNGVFNDWILGVLIDIDSGFLNVDLSGNNLVTFNLQLDRDTLIPVLWFLTMVFSLIWRARCSRKQISFRQIKSTIEGEILILKSTCYSSMAELIEKAVNFISY